MIWFYFIFVGHFLDDKDGPYQRIEKIMAVSTFNLINFMPGWMIESPLTTDFNYFVADLQQGCKERLNKRLKETTTISSLKWDELVGSSYPKTTFN